VSVPMVDVSPAPPKPAIRVRHLWHRFGKNEVLRDVSFDVAEGEIFGFIGPNGAGKTTTIRIMATLLEPIAGKVEIDGFDVTVDPQQVRRVIGYMPDHAGVYERLTVREYLEFFADAYKVPTAGTTYAVVDAVMELTDLAKLRDKLVATMSKGMKQRLQLARTLLHDPKVLVLDEPASDLDPRARIEIRDLLVELRSMGKTIFLSSHILTELADICTSVAILEQGRLVAAGPISEIARRLEAAFATATATSTSTSTAPATARAIPIRSLRVRALAPTDAVYAAVVSVPGVQSVSAGPGGSAAIAYVGDDAIVAAIVRALVVANVPVVGVEPERNELERIFLEVTKGEVQ
jgi:ABC-2 type transport system ATP-binding protein